MKNKRNLHLGVSLICFVFAVVCAVIYGFWRDDTVRFLAAGDDGNFLFRYIRTKIV